VTTERFRGARAAIARRLREPCPVIRAAAADSVARIGVSADTAAIRSALRHLLDEEDPTVLVAGLRAVGGFKDRATRPLIDRLPRLLEHPSAEVRDEAARAVASVGPRAARRAIVAALTRRIRSDETPQEALLAYAAIKVRPCELVLSELPRLLQHDSAQTVAAALQVVSVAGPLAGTDAIILGVVRILSSKNPDLIQRGLHALTAIGRPAGREDVILALEEILYAGSHSHTQAAIGAVRALGNVAFGRLMSGLMTVLAGPDRAKRDAAVRLTRSLREQAASPEVLDRLARLLQHEDPGIRASAVAALEGLGPAAATPGILEQLAELKGDADAAVRYHVGEALFALG
jgi:HEAT repeat protein